MENGDIILYSGIIMTESGFRGRLIVNSVCPPVELDGPLKTAIEAIHASWRFPAERNDGRREHRHEVFHFVAVTGGRGSFLIEGENCPFDGPSLFLVDPFVPHVFSTRAAECAEYHEFTFGVRGKSAPRGWGELLTAVFMKPSLSGRYPIPSVLVLDEDSFALTGSLIKGITRILVSRSPSPLFSSYIRMLIACAFERVEAGEPGAAGKEACDPLEKAKAYLELRYSERFDLARLAAAAGLSEKHLCRAFGKRYGTTPFRMKRELAMRSAGRLLSSTRYPIKSVAETVGFDDMYHFAKAFRAWSGMPPGRFRAERSGGKTELPEA